MKTIQYVLIHEAHTISYQITHLWASANLGHVLLIFNLNF